MSAKKMESSFCFICLEGLKVKTGRKRKLMSKKKGESEFNLLMKYSLQTRSKTYDTVFKDILKLVGNGYATNKAESKETQVKQLVRLCEKCETIGAKLLELHLELEKIQMRIINEVRSVRRAVLSSSGWLGGIGKEDGSEAEGFKQFLKKFRTGVVASSKEQKELYKVLKAFQIAVTEIDGDSVHIPLVYLDKYKIAVPAENPNIFLGTVPDIVKTEPVDTESFQDIVESSDTASDFYEEMCQEDGEEAPTVKTQFETIPSTSSALTPDVIKSEFDLHLKSENDDGEEKSLKKSNRGGRRRKKRKTARKPLLSKKKRAELRAQQPRISKPVLNPLQTVSKRHHCASCNFSSKVMCRFEQHLREHETDEKEFHCDKCNVGFTSQQLYVIHQGRHKGIYNFKCDVCQTFINAFDLPTHLKTHVEEVFPCPYCSYCSSSRNMHLIHLNIFHAGVNMTCDICGESFKTKKSLVEHFADIHKAIEMLKCDFEGCNKTFSSREILRSHENVHTDRFVCKVCHKRFASKHSLQGHQRVHSQVPEKPLKCDQCPEAFRAADVLQTHLIRDHGAPKLECKVCGKKYITRPALRYHMGKEHNIGPEKCKCKICNENFVVPSKLRDHMESCHSKEHNYVCEECGKAFRTSNRYTVHKKIHGEKTQKCPFCPKTFAQRNVWRQHVRIHTGVKPYPCQFCGKAFNQATSRNAHRKKCQVQSANLTGNPTESTAAI